MLYNTHDGLTIDVEQIEAVSAPKELKDKQGKVMHGYYIYMKSGTIFIQDSKLPETIQQERKNIVDKWVESKV